MKNLIIILLVLLSGCATIGEQVLKAGTTGAIRFTAEDINAAIVIAQNAKDVLGETCAKSLLPYTTPGVEPETKGIVSVYMAAREARKALKAGLAEDVKVACAPLIIDSASFARHLGIVLVP